MDNDPRDAKELLLKMRKAVMDFENKHGKPRTEPFELTRVQLERLKTECQATFDMPDSEPLNAFFGVPIVVKG